MRGEQHFFGVWSFHGFLGIEDVGEMAGSSD